MRAWSLRFHLSRCVKGRTQVPGRFQLAAHSSSAGTGAYYLVPAGYRVFKEWNRLFLQIWTTILSTTVYQQLFAKDVLLALREHRTHGTVRKTTNLNSLGNFKSMLNSDNKNRQMQSTLICSSCSSSWVYFSFVEDQTIASVSFSPVACIEAMLSLLWVLHGSLATIHSRRFCCMSDPSRTIRNSYLSYLPFFSHCLRKDLPVSLADNSK